jgi:hypothetical protein
MLHFSAKSIAFSTDRRTGIDSSRVIATDVVPIQSKAPAGYVLLSAQGAMQALLDHRRVIDLEVRIKDLAELMEVKDTHIARQERVITELSTQAKTMRDQLVTQPAAVARSDTDKRKLIWSKIENWGWRGLAAFSVYKILSR